MEFQLQHQSFQITPRTDLISDGLVGSPCSPRNSIENFKKLNHRRKMNDPDDRIFEIIQSKEEKIKKKNKIHTYIYIYTYIHTHTL